jgi:hypothetical protein
MDNSLSVPTNQEPILVSPTGQSGRTICLRTPSPNEQEKGAPRKYRSAPFDDLI